MLYLLILLLCAPLACTAKKDPAPIHCNELHHFMMASYYHFGNQPKEAEYWYKLLHQNNSNKAFYVGYIPFLAATNSKALLPIIDRLDDAFSNNVEIQLIIASALEQSGNLYRAQELLMSLFENHKTHQELAFKVAQICINNRQPEKALAVIDAHLNNSPRKPNNFIFYFLKAQLAMGLNKAKEALDAITMCIEQYPKFDKGWLLYAVMHEQAGNIDNALNGFTSFLEVFPERNNEIEQHLIQLAVKQRLPSASETYTKHCISKALALFEQREYRKALQEINICIHDNPQSAEAQLAKVQVLVAQKSYDQAVDTLVSLALNDAKTEWLEALHLLYATPTPPTLIMQGYENILKKHPHNLTAQLYYLDILLKEQKTEQALPLLLKAEAACTDTAVKARILYQCALIYYDTNQQEELRKALLSIRKYDKNFMPAANLLAYHYAETGDDLAQAQQLIDQVLAHHPENPHFLDTQALIRYKQKNYEQALALLEKCANICPEDVTILKHLSKTLYKLGNRNRAVQTLQTAQQFATHTEQAQLNTLITRWSTKKT